MPFENASSGDGDTGMLDADENPFSSLATSLADEMMQEEPEDYDDAIADIVGDIFDDLHSDQDTDHASDHEPEESAAPKPVESSESTKKDDENEEVTPIDLHAVGNAIAELVSKSGLVKSNIDGNNKENASSEDRLLTRESVEPVKKPEPEVSQDSEGEEADPVAAAISRMVEATVQQLHESGQDHDQRPDKSQNQSQNEDQHHYQDQDQGHSQSHSQAHDPDHDQKHLSQDSHEDLDDLHTEALLSLIVSNAMEQLRGSADDEEVDYEHAPATQGSHAEKQGDSFDAAMSDMIKSVADEIVAEDSHDQAQDLNNAIEEMVKNVVDETYEHPGAQSNAYLSTLALARNLLIDLLLSRRLNSSSTTLFLAKDYESTPFLRDLLSKHTTLAGLRLGFFSNYSSTDGPATLSSEAALAPLSGPPKSATLSLTINLVVQNILANQRLSTALRVDSRERVRLENRTRKQRWREKNNARNKDNDLRFRLLRRAAVLFGPGDSEEKSRWMAAEFERRKTKRLERGGTLRRDDNAVYPRARSESAAGAIARALTGASAPAAFRSLPAELSGELRGAIAGALEAARVDVPQEKLTSLVAQYLAGFFGEKENDAGRKVAEKVAERGPPKAAASFRLPVYRREENSGPTGITGTPGSSIGANGGVGTNGRKRVKKPSLLAALDMHRPLGSQVQRKRVGGVFRRPVYKAK